jgi:hypothetical protein
LTEPFDLQFRRCDLSTLEGAPQGGVYPTVRRREVLAVFRCRHKPVLPGDIFENSSLTDREIENRVVRIHEYVIVFSLFHWLEGYCRRYAPGHNAEVGFTKLTPFTTGSIIFEKSLGVSMKPASRRLFFLVAFFLFTASHVFAQVFPKTEFLDVVTLSDGTVLRGIIVEDVPERYVEIELWGGSRFVLGYGQIESIEAEPNPDYGTTWIKVERDIVSALDGARASDTGVTEDRNADVADAAPEAESFRAGGHIIGVFIGAAGGFYFGDDWDELIDSLPGDPEQSAEVYPEVGLAYTFLSQPNRFSGTPWMLGFRGAFGFGTRETYVVTEDDFGEQYDYWEWVEPVQVPIEALVGVGYDRFGLLAGVGTGISFLPGDPRYEVEGPGFDEYDTYETDTDVVPIYSLSLNGYVRIGSRWMADARLAYDGIIVPWDSNRDVLYSGLAFTVGIGYRFGNE